MKTFSLALMCMALIACKTPQNEFAKLADQACECADSDSACGAKVLASVKQFTAEHSANGDKAWVEAGVRLNDCLTSAGVKPTDVTTVLAQLEH